MQHHLMCKLCAGLQSQNSRKVTSRLHLIKHQFMCTSKTFFYSLNWPFDIFHTLRNGLWLKPSTQYKRKKIPHFTCEFSQCNNNTAGLSGSAKSETSIKNQRLSTALVIGGSCFELPFFIQGDEGGRRERMLACTAGSANLLKKATGLHLVCGAGGLFTPQMIATVH